MRLPAPEELQLEEHRVLYKHDIKGLHAPGTTTVSLEYRDRLQAIVDAVERHAASGIVVDVACAQGNIALTLAARGWSTIALDLRRAYLTYALLKAEGERIAAVAGSADQLPLRSGAAHVVVLGEVLEHAAYPESLIREAARVLAPGGILIATTPNGGFIGKRLGTLASVSDRRQLEGVQFEPDSDGHLFLMTREELVVMGTGSGLVLVEHRFLHSPAITGWPRSQWLADRLAPSIRLQLDQAVQRVSRLARRLDVGQLVVLRRPA